MKLQGGYIIDEIFNLIYKRKSYDNYETAIQEFSKYCIFELRGLEEYELSVETQNLDKTLLTVYNIINRGNPTRASLLISEKILSKYGFQKKNNKKKNDGKVKKKIIKNTSFI